MTHPDTKPEALRLADALDARVVTRWVHATGTTPRSSGHSPDTQCRAAADRLRRLHAECESLRTQLAEARAEQERLREHAVILANTERHVALQEAEALRADARRYRWLRDMAQGSDWEHIGNVYPPEETDAAIDAAMGAKEGE